MIKPVAKIFIVLALIVTISSCSRDGCKNVSCPDKINPITNVEFGQQCVSGKCVCEDGYEGALCDTLSANKYLHQYTVNESCYNTTTGIDLGAFSYYTVNIVLCNNCINNGVNYPNALLIEGLFGLSIDAEAFISTDETNQGNTITIPPQNGSGVSYQGNGTYNPANGYITINFTYTYQGNTYQCTHIFRP